VDRRSCLRSATSAVADGGRNLPPLLLEGRHGRVATFRSRVTKQRAVVAVPARVQWRCPRSKRVRAVLVGPTVAVTRCRRRGRSRGGPEREGRRIYPRLQR
jgi:hypothetical protein